MILAESLQAITGRSDQPSRQAMAWQASDLRQVTRLRMCFGVAGELGF